MIPEEYELSNSELRDYPNEQVLNTPKDYIQSIIDPNTIKTEDLLSTMKAFGLIRPSISNMNEQDDIQGKKQDIIQEVKV